MNYKFYSSCMNWSLSKVDCDGGLTDMIDAAKKISRQKFIKNVGLDQLRPLEEACGYAAHPKQGLTMAGDQYVTYHRSLLNGYTVYYFRWSAAEYVFVPTGFSWDTPGGKDNG